VIANSVVVTGRLHVLDPISSEWDFQDGIGAAPISTKQGAAATDFSNVLTLSVQQAAPAAESFAMKDAAEKFGRIFGKDLNRATIETNYMLDSLQRKEDQLKRVEQNLQNILNKKDNGN
jgi:hypothetical protein